jgi:hypothetical protein
MSSRELMCIKSDFQQRRKYTCIRCLHSRMADGDVSSRLGEQPAFKHRLMFVRLGGNPSSFKAVCVLLFSEVLLVDR